MYGDKRLEIAIFVLSLLVFFLFGKNMTFGYHFSPCDVKLTFDRNELELNLLKIFLNKYFGEILK